MPHDKRRILFVDDQEQVLQGLRASLRRERRRWDMRFASSGEAALEELAREPADVVVSDMRMPGMDGASLLLHVRALLPDCLRIILSGQADEESTLRALPYTHQWMAKPTGREQIVSVIDRACAMRDLLGSEDVQAVVGGISSLPSPPEVYERVLKTLEHPSVDLARVVEVIESDPALSAKVLQMANSAFFGLGETLGTVHEATKALGFSTLSRLVLAGEFIQRDVEDKSFDMLQFRLHTTLSGRLAGRIAKATDSSELATTASLLHDVGRLILASHPTALAREVLGCPALVDLEQERERLGTTHAEIGAVLLGNWGLPTEIVEAVAFHHEPARANSAGLSTTLVVHTASTLAWEQVAPDHPYTLDVGLIEESGWEDQLDTWRSWAREELGQMQSDREAA